MHDSRCDVMQERSLECSCGADKLVLFPKVIILRKEKPAR